MSVVNVESEIFAVVVYINSKLAGRAGGGEIQPDIQNYGGGAGAGAVRPMSALAQGEGRGAQCPRCAVCADRSPYGNRTRTDARNDS